MDTNTTRRTILAGLAAAPVAGLPAMAGVVAEADPIFAIIERYEQAHAAYNQSEEGPDQDAAYDLYVNAELAMHSTEPRTGAGAARLLRVIAEFLDDDVINDNLVGDKVGNTIRNAIAVLERGPQS